MPVSELRYIKRSNLTEQKEIIKGLYRELIRSFGHDCIYLRHNTDAFRAISGERFNYIYGEDTTKDYVTSANLIVYIDMNNDSIVMSKFGFEVNGDNSVYIHQQDFNEAFRDSLATITSDTFSNTVSSTITAYTGTVSGIIDNSSISGIASGIVTIDPDVDMSGLEVSGLAFSSNFYVDPSPFVDFIAYSPNFYYTRSVSGSLSGSLSGVLDADGDGSISGTISGLLYYHTNIADLAGPNWGIAPQVGDIFRLDFDTINQEEYEITRVYDKDLTANGLNPLLSRYIWKCDCTRRPPSHENISATTKKEEEFTTSRTDLQDVIESKSNDIFNYDTEAVDAIDKDTKQDSVYGGYGTP